MQSQYKPSICLNMIVKNEASVIKRCLDSVKDFIDYWVISDTGSTDGTQDIIIDYFAEHRIKGELLHHDWQDFSTNRNAALDAARGKADYILFMDADDIFFSIGINPFVNLSADCYFLPIELDSLKYSLIKLIKADKQFAWEGVLHEYIVCNEEHSVAEISGFTIKASSTEGFRSRNPQKYLDDVAVFEKALLSDPNNARYRYYLAQSYRDAGDYQNAIINYRLRAAMPVWDQEQWHALYQVARLQEHIELSSDIVISGYLDAYRMRPERAESLFHLYDYCRRLSAAMPMTDDILFVEPECYGVLS